MSPRFRVQKTCYVSKYLYGNLWRGFEMCNCCQQTELLSRPSHHWARLASTYINRASCNIVKLFCLLRTFVRGLTMPIRRDIRKEKRILHYSWHDTWYGPILTWPDIIYKQYLSDLGLGLKLPSLEHMRQDMKYFAAFNNFALHLVKIFVVVYLGLGARHGPACLQCQGLLLCSLCPGTCSRERSAESTLTAALQPATGALKLQWDLQHESCSRNCTQQVAPSPPIGSGTCLVTLIGRAKCAI